MSKVSRFVRPTLEVLEGRVVPAGNVLVIVKGDAVTITGDAQANQIEISPGIEDDEIFFQGLDGTTVNGSPFRVDLSVDGGIGNLTIKMNAGADRVVLTNRSETNPLWPMFTSPGDANEPLYIHGSLSYDGGDAADIFQARNVKIHAGLTVKTGTGKIVGDEIVVLENVRVGKNMSVESTSGADRMLFSKLLVAGATTIKTGKGNDAVGLFDSNLKGTVTATLGTGHDEAWVERNRFSKKVSVDLGKDAGDQLTKNPTDNASTGNIFNVPLALKGPVGFVPALSLLTEVHFDYDPLSFESPANWGRLTPAWLLTEAGRMQTPINIDTINLPTTALPSIEFFYQAAVDSEFEHNGHTVEVKPHVAAGVPPWLIHVNDRTYELLQFHFHAGSEHTIDGQSFPMEMHLVHRDVFGNLLVVGVFLTGGGPENPAYADLVANLPANDGVNDHKTIAAPLNPLDLLPLDLGSFYAYSGSLTTPAGAEQVSWALLATTVMLSDAQLSAIKTAIGHHDNNRPTQPVNDRPVLKSF